jgi:biotin carboxylase
MPTTTYRAEDFLQAAADLGLEVVYATDRCHVLDELGAVPMPGDSLVLDFRDVPGSVEKIADYASKKAVGAVIAVDDQTAPIAALAQAALDLPHNAPAGAAASKDKLRMRLMLARSGVLQPRFVAVRRAIDPQAAARFVGRRIGFPCVLKPRSLSASRGVIRADDRASFSRAFERLGRILADPEVKAKSGARARSIVVESFVPGEEVALEGLLDGGDLRVLALFDKPDPLDGPFFEETIYVTPSRKSEAAVREIRAVVAQAARALGLVDGPIHAELRVSDRGAFLIEIAARSIGGLCARTLRFGVGMSLEELILRHAFGRMSGDDWQRDRRAAGVMMLPIPRTGVLKSVRGVDRARAVPLIEDVVITAPIDREIVALPEGNAYLGFVFARGDSPRDVEEALRTAHRALAIEIATRIPVVR